MDVHYTPKRIFRLYEDDLKFYSKQLYELVNLYRKHIYIRTDKQLQALNELEYYANQLINKNYNAVITNADEIISKDDPSNDVPF